MRVFVPMPDVWDDPEAFRGLKLVPYRAGMALWAGPAFAPPAAAAVPAAPTPAPAPADDAQPPRAA